MTHGIEQAEGSQHGQGKRKYNLPQDSDIGAAVDGRRLLQFLGNPLEEILDDHQVIGGDRPGQQYGPEGILQVQDVGNDDIARDHAAGKEHGDDDHIQEEVPSAQPLLGQGIGHGHREKQVDGRTADGDENRIAETLQDFVRGEDKLVSVQGHILRDDEHRSGCDFIFRGKGRADNVDEGEQRRQGNQGNNQVVHHVEDPAAQRGILADRTAGDLHLRDVLAVDDDAFGHLLFLHAGSLLSTAPARRAGGQSCWSQARVSHSRWTSSGRWRKHS